MKKIIFIFTLFSLFNFSMAQDDSINTFISENINNSNTLFEKSVELVNNKDNKNAIKILNTLIKTKPQLVEAYNNLAVIYFNENNFKKAEEVLILATTINPKYEQGFTNLADLHLVIANNYYKNAFLINQNNNQTNLKINKLRELITILDEQNKK
jgi:tetratricopeptide (TPR) repeat protein